MALTFPDYFPESFLARVVAADAAAEFECRGEMSSAQCDVQRAITRYVHTVVLSTCRTRAGSSAKIRTWAAAHEAHVTTFHSANARVRSAR